MKVPRTSRAIAAASLVLALVAVALVLRDAGGEERTIRAAFDSATNVVPGLEVRVAGRKVGEIRSSELVNGHAILELSIEDERVWPLRRGTFARLRYGTPLGYATRVVELKPGSPANPPLRPGALLTRAETETPVEFDQVVRIMNKKGRRDLRGMLANGSAALKGRADDLGRGLGSSADGLDAVADLTHELGADQEALSTLVRAGAHTAQAIATRDAELRELVSRAAATYDELSRHTSATTDALERFPRTLATSRRTLARLESSISHVRALTSDLDPGARELRRLAPSAARALSTLRDVAPLATDTLQRASTAAPSIRSLLDAGGPFVSRLAKVSGELAPMVGCLRPYAPELAGFISTWAGFSKNHDAIDHHTRTLPQALPFPNGSQMTSEELVRSTPGVKYAFPRPPGLNAGQPWFLPECGAGPGSLDPSRDPEAQR